ncbi:MAG: UDP-N-acetylmuramoyl-L-alanine--D-glutamate ligase [Candidatus Omnitrophica bacterium]|nr:UDP-N-acetylmuramoyl-L-alanine--D-glutamate ligase [Candidatus Omnitrophota bacterium]
MDVNIKGKKIIVAGMGCSGQAAALLARHNGADVYISEKDDNVWLRRRSQLLRKKGIHVELGRHSAGFLKGARFLITSPGLKKESFPIRWARKNKVLIVSEIEFASWFCRAPIIAITGTNGKSTVTRLIGQILKNAGKRAIVCGNIGKAFSGEVGKTKSSKFVVLEVSSFALEYIKHFRPKVSIILNFSRNHIDHHKTMSAYFHAKCRVLSNQQGSDYAILNFDDPALRNLCKKTKARSLFTSGNRHEFKRYSRRFSGACWIENGKIKCLWKGRVNDILPISRAKLKGAHNLKNIMAAVLAAKIAGVRNKTIAETAINFKALEHRCEHVAKIGGVRFINDSKSTTTDATVNALKIFEGKSVILICGGLDKGSDFRPICELVRAKTNLVVLIGKASRKIKAAWAGKVNTVIAADLEGAIKIAYRYSRPGMHILLSPMCASFDMFKNFEERGKVFKQLVYRLQVDGL